MITVWISHWCVYTNSNRAARQALVDSMKKERLWQFADLGAASWLSPPDPAFDDSAWQQVDLPHDYSITQKYSQSNEAESAYLPGGTGWYRKSFTIDRDLAGKRIAINFDGVYMNATVWFNGVKLGTHPYGYSPFSFDLTGNAKFGGENTIVVKDCRPAAGTPAPASTATSPSPSPTACTSAITAWPSRPRASPPKTAAT